MAWMWTVIGLAATAHAGNRLAWQTPGTSTYTPSTTAPEHAEQVCPDSTEVVAGWAVSGFADLSTRMWWQPPGARALEADWWSGAYAHPAQSFSQLLYGGGEHQVSALCANPGHCMNTVRASAASVATTRTVQVACPATMYAIAGGYRVTGKTDLWRSGNVIRITQSEATGIFGPTGWIATATSTVLGDWGLEVEATCVPWEALAYVRTAALDEVWADSFGVATLGKPHGNQPFYPLADMGDLLPLSTGVKTHPNDGLVGAPARNLLWTVEDGPFPQPLGAANTTPSLAPSGWQVRPFGLAHTASPDPNHYATDADGTLMYVAAADRAAFEAAAYCDGDRRTAAPSWFDVAPPVAFVRPFRPIVYLPLTLPVDDPLGPPPFGAVADGLPFGVMTYPREDGLVYLTDLEAALDAAEQPWVEVSSVEQTFDFDGDTVVLVTPDPGGEGALAEWIVAKREELLGITHPTVVLLTEGGEGAQALGLGGGDLW